MTSSVFGVIISSQKQIFDHFREILFQIENFNAIHTKIGKAGINMNAYYERTNREAIADNHSININFGDSIISIICAIVAFFTSSVAVKVEKALLATAGFVGFFGVIGSMDNGNIGMIGGILLCAVFSLVEFFIFKSMIKSKKISE